MASLAEIGNTLVTSGNGWVADTGYIMLAVSSIIYKVKAGGDMDIKETASQGLTYSGITGQALILYSQMDWKFTLTFLATCVGLYLTWQSLKEKRRAREVQDRATEVKDRATEEAKRANDLKERELNQKESKKDDEA